MAIRLKGLFTPPAPEDRDILYLEIDYRGNTYDWQTYMPMGNNISEYLDSIENDLYAQIDAKELEWENLEPKTRTIEDPMMIGEPIIVDISKEEIVKADFPDYYAKRRAEYPPIGEQLGALYKGVDSPEYADMLQKITDIKSKYPKI